MDKYDYDFKNDIRAYLDAKQMLPEDFCRVAGISRQAFSLAMEKTPGKEVMEKAYSAIYADGFLLNQAKDELYHDEAGSDSLLLYHGSKFGLDDINPENDRAESDLGPGFYASLSFSSAASFVNSFPSSLVYLFSMDIGDLSVLELDAGEAWMLLIAHNRGYLEKYKDSPKLKKVLAEASGKDLIVAPIADNKMFQVLDEFANGMINLDQARYCLSSSRLGKQYVLKSSRAASRLQFLARFYLCRDEKRASVEQGRRHADLIASKLSLAKRKYRGKGKYIEELL